MKQTREQWLEGLRANLAPTFEHLGHPLPAKVRLSCGLPSKRAFSKTKRLIGQCWDSKQSEDGTHEVFISPTIADPLVVAETVAHELVHAAVGVKAGHRAAFKKCAVALGLEGKMTSTHAGEALKATLSRYVDTLGVYPHAVIDFESRKKDGTRMLKLECPSCGYTVRTTQKWLDVGLPVCPCGGTLANV